MKIEDVKLGWFYRSSDGTVGMASELLPLYNNVKLTGTYMIKNAGFKRFDKWVHAQDIEPVDESPKEEPLPRRLEQVIQMSIDENHDPSLSDILNAYKMDIAEIEARRAYTGPLSLANTPVSQMTYRMYLIAQGFAGWAADSRADDRDLPAIPIAADELIAEMESKKE